MIKEKMSISFSLEVETIKLYHGPSQKEKLLRMIQNGEQSRKSCMDTLTSFKIYLSHSIHDMPSLHLGIILSDYGTFRKERPWKPSLIILPMFSHALSQLTIDKSLLEEETRKLRFGTQRVNASTLLMKMSTMIGFLLLNSLTIQRNQH